MGEGGPKKLIDLSKEEQLKFFESFDTVLSDVDGVLCHLNQEEIEGTPESITALRNLGKQCYFVTNNSIFPLKYFVEHRLKKFNAVEDEVMSPFTAIRWYLRSINFNKEIYVIGVEHFKNEIKNAGYKVVTDEMETVVEKPEEFIKALKSISPEVGAVAIDYAVNVSFIQLQRCVEYITKNNALFLVGCWDRIIPYRNVTNLIGTAFFIQGIEDVSGKKPMILSKPGKEFNDYILERLGPLDPKRVLFIGDSAITDMAFATKFGYQKLLPLTGVVTKNDLQNWRFDEEWKPDYYVDSIKDLHTIINNLGLNNTKL